MARELKTKNSRRTLPLTPVVRAALLAHAEKNILTTPLNIPISAALCHLPVMNNSAIPPFNPYFELSTKGTVIVSGAGTPLEPRNLARCFHSLTKKAGLPRIKLHATRHTTATILKDLLVPIKDVQLILGHSNITTTLNIYQHGTPENFSASLSAAGQQLLPA
jgi:Site-specific recombinase XerD